MVYMYIFLSFIFIENDLHVSGPAQFKPVFIVQGSTVLM